MANLWNRAAAAMFGLAILALAAGATLLVIVWVTGNAGTATGHEEGTIGSSLIYASYALVVLAIGVAGFGFLLRLLYK